MEQKYWIWAAIRILGVCLIVMAIIGLPELVLSGIETHTNQERIEFHKARPLADERLAQHREETVHHFQSQYEDARARLIAGLVRAGLLLAGGAYCLKRGKLVFKVILSAEPRQVE